MSSCFNDICECTCNVQYSDIDRILKSEVKFGVTLKDITHSNIGWFSDKSIESDHFLYSWIEDPVSGIYILWHKNGYCEKHDFFHMKAIYVGKGNIAKRIISHFQEKDFSEELLVYFTYLMIENRKAKYIEQLILDTYEVPYNKSENSGTQKLCTYFTQSEVD